MTNFHGRTCDFLHTRRTRIRPSYRARLEMLGRLRWCQYPWAAACWLTSGLFLCDSTWIIRNTAHYIRHPVDQHLSDLPTIGNDSSNYARTDYYSINTDFPLAFFSGIISRPPLPLWQTLTASSKLSVRCATSNHKLTTTVSFLQYNTLTQCSFIHILLSTWYLFWTFIACCGGGGGT